MKLSREQILERLNKIVGENDSDEYLEFLSDIDDTFATDPDSTDWKKKFEDNDKEWRKKYRERFFTGKGDPANDPEDPSNDPDPEENKKIDGYDDLIFGKEK